MDHFQMVQKELRSTMFWGHGVKKKFATTPEKYVELAFEGVTIKITESMVSVTTDKTQCIRSYYDDTWLHRIVYACYHHALLLDGP